MIWTISIIISLILCGCGIAYIHTKKYNLIKAFEERTTWNWLGLNYSQWGVIATLLFIIIICMIPIANIVLGLFLVFAPITLTLCEKLWEWMKNNGFEE